MCGKPHHAKHTTIVFFPSAIITHANIPIQPGETRQSITTYSAAGLYRFVEQGYVLAPKVKQTAEVKRKKTAEGLKRWIEGCGRFSSLAELRRRWGPKSLYREE